MEFRGTVTTNRTCQIILISKVVFQFSKVTFQRIFSRVACQTLVLSSVAEVRVSRVSKVSHVTFQILVLVILGFVTQQYREVVFTEFMAPVQQLVEVQCTTTASVVITTTTYSSSVTTNRSSKLSISVVEYVVCHVQSKLEVVQEVGFEVTTSTQVVGHVLVQAFSSSSVWILFSCIRTNVFSTEVVTYVTLFVVHQLTVCIVQIDRIDRSNVLREHKDVRVVTTFRTERFTDSVSVCKVTTYTEVLTDVLVYLYTSRDTVET